MFGNHKRSVKKSIHFDLKPVIWPWVYWSDVEKQWLVTLGHFDVCFVNAVETINTSMIKELVICMCLGWDRKTCFTCHYCICVGITPWGSRYEEFFLHCTWHLMIWEFIVNSNKFNLIKCIETCEESETTGPSLFVFMFYPRGVDPFSSMSLLQSIN